VFSGSVANTMECIEARRLIAEGVFSGTSAALDSDLWQHLAHCEACRAHYETQRVLFGELLPQEDIPPLPPRTPPKHPPPTSGESSGWGGPVSLVAAEASPRHAPKTAAPMPLARWLWILAIVLLVGGPAVGGTWFALVLFRAHQNVSAMIVPTASQQPTAASAAASPTSLLPPSPATLPTASPTPFPTAPPTATPPIKLAPSPPPPPAPSSIPTSPALPVGSEIPLMPPLAVVSPQSSRQHPTSWPTIQSLPPVRPASWPTIPVAPAPPPPPTRPPPRKHPTPAGGDACRNPAHARPAVGFDTKRVGGSDRRSSDPAPSWE
jgi:hypothetical protein